MPRRPRTARRARRKTRAQAPAPPRLHRVVLLAGRGPLVATPSPARAWTDELRDRYYDLLITFDLRHAMRRVVIPRLPELPPTAMELEAEYGDQRWAQRCYHLFQPALKKLSELAVTRSLDLRFPLEVLEELRGDVLRIHLDRGRVRTMSLDDGDRKRIRRNLATAATEALAYFKAREPDPLPGREPDVLYPVLRTLADEGRHVDEALAAYRQEHPDAKALPEYVEVPLLLRDWRPDLEGLETKPGVAAQEQAIRRADERLRRWVPPETRVMLFKAMGLRQLADDERQPLEADDLSEAAKRAASGPFPAPPPPLSFRLPR